MWLDMKIPINNKAENSEDYNHNNRSVRVFEYSLGTRYELRFSNSIKEDLSDYMKALTIMDNASEEDIVDIYLTNFGGVCHTGLIIAHTIRNCKALTTIYVSGDSYSMGSIIALSGNNLKIQPHSVLMFHNYSTIEVGKGGEIKLSVEEYGRHFHNSLKHFCYPFLTTKELKTISHDSDVYVHADGSPEFEARLQRHFPHRKMIQQIEGAGEIKVTVTKQKKVKKSEG